MTINYFQQLICIDDHYHLNKTIIYSSRTKLYLSFILKEFQVENEFDLRELKKTEIEYFKRCAKYWYNYFHMTNWCLQVECLNLEEPAFAMFQGSIPDMHGVITLNQSWPIHMISNLELDRVAFHEVCEMLIYPLTVISEQRFNVIPEGITREVHSIIRVLENTVFKHGKR